MSQLEALWLGILQGLTEFLPVSSSGHLVILQTLLGVSEAEGGLVFEVALHAATPSPSACWGGPSSRRSSAIPPWPASVCW